MNYYLNKESVFITASRSYILTLCVTVLHTWVRTLRCSRCCLCLESRRPSWFPRVSLRTGRTTGRTSCSWMTPELETQTRRRRTITSEQQRAQTTAESRPGLGMSWGVNPFWKIKITMWLLSRWEIFQPYFLFLISLNQQTQVSTYTDMMSETPVSLRFHHHSVEYIHIHQMKTILKVCVCVHSKRDSCQQTLTVFDGIFNGFGWEDGVEWHFGPLVYIYIKKKNQTYTQTVFFVHTVYMETQVASPLLEKVPKTLHS